MFLYFKMPRPEDNEVLEIDRHCSLAVILNVLFIGAKNGAVSLNPDKIFESPWGIC